MIERGKTNVSGVVVAAARKWSPLLQSWLLLLLQQGSEKRERGCIGTHENRWISLCLPLSIPGCRCLLCCPVFLRLICSSLPPSLSPQLPSLEDALTRTRLPLRPLTRREGITKITFFLRRFLFPWHLMHTSTDHPFRRPVRLARHHPLQIR